jgi:hypothetical protein
LPTDIIDTNYSGYLPLSPFEDLYPTPIASNTKSFELIGTTIMSNSTLQQRNKIFESLNYFGVGVTTNGKLNQFEKNIESIFQVNPMIGEVGCQLTS